MKKNRFWTLFFSLFPGAGQMYLGYLQRGLSLMSLFCACIAAASMVYLFGFALPVIWAYAFFDTFRLANQPEDEPRIPDALLFGLETGDLSLVKGFLAQRHSLLGWALVLLGSWLVLERFVLRTVSDFLVGYDLWPLHSLVNRIPNLIVAVLLIVLGVHLMKGRKPQEPPAPFVTYQPAELEQPAEPLKAEEPEQADEEGSSNE